MNPWSVLQNTMQESEQRFGIAEWLMVAALAGLGYLLYRAASR
jgi:hypothetical protein